MRTKLLDTNPVRPLKFVWKKSPEIPVIGILVPFGIVVIIDAVVEGAERMFKTPPAVVTVPNPVTLTKGAATQPVLPLKFIW